MESRIASWSNRRASRTPAELGLREGRAVAVREKAELIIGAYLRAIEAGDWRASESLLTGVFGRPQEKRALHVAPLLRP
jgi:hypothetical protein